MEDKVKKEKILKISQEARELAEKVIEKEELNMGGATIEYVLVYPSISKTVVGRCMRANRELNFFTKLNYIIELSGELWDSLSEEIKYIVLLHELLHVFPEADLKTGEIKYKLCDHDVKDFYRIIEKFGIHWFNDLKTQTVSIHDLNEKEEKRVKL
jgi:predicted metallopeptidase